MKRTTIDNLGRINLKGVKTENGTIEVHIPVEDITDPLDTILDKCSDNFLEKHQDVTADELQFDIRVIYSFGGYKSGNKNESEFMLEVIIWKISDDSVVEFYEEIPIEFGKEDTKKLKKIIWDALGEMLFNI